MRNTILQAGRFATGATFAGLLVGAAEALYRDAPVAYAMLLYGTLWAVVGSGLGAVAAVTAMALGRRYVVAATRLPLGAFGAALAGGASTAVLLRFALLRDVFAEAPGKAVAVAATAVSLAGASAAAALLFFGVRRALRHRARHLGPPGPPALVALLPLATVATFAVVVATARDDALPARVAEAARPLQGSGVILVIADTLRADALGAYGAPPHRGAPISPAFDALSHRGRLFTDASAQASWTKPAVASILTSRHASGHLTMSKAAALPAALPTLAQVLQQAGVHTAAVITNYNLEADFGFARGFDAYEYLAPARYLGAPARAKRLAAYDVYRLVRERWLTTSRQARHFYRNATHVNATAMQWLDAGAGDGRFFAWLHYMEPHDPYFSTTGASYARVSTPHPPVRWAEAMRAAYRDDVRRVDAGLGELLQALQARGLQQRVTVVVVADHGEEFGEHGGFYHGTTLYEEQLQIPLVIAGPRVVPKRDARIARQIDLAPTIAALFGVAAPESWEGRDLLAATPSAGDIAADEPSGTLSEEDHEGNRLVAWRARPRAHAAVPDGAEAGAFKLIVANPDNPRGLRASELYDLANDPQEQRPLATHDARVGQMQAALAAACEAARVGGAAAVAERTLDDEAKAAMRALGYVR